MIYTVGGLPTEEVWAFLEATAHALQDMDERERKAYLSLTGWRVRDYAIHPCGAEIFCLYGELAFSWSKAGVKSSWEEVRYELEHRR